MTSTSQPHPDLPAAVRAVIERAPDPLGVEAIRKQLTGPFAVPKKNKAELANLLEAEVARGVLWRWRPGANPLYWYRSPVEAADQALSDASAGQALTITELRARVPKRVKAFATKERIAALVAEGRLHPDPLFGGGSKTRLFSRLDSIETYRAQLDTALRFLLHRYQGLGLVTPGISSEAPRLDAAKLEQTMLQVLDRLDPSHRALVAVENVRSSPELAGVAKAEFDSAAMSLYHARKVYLHYHTAPHTLDERERDILIADGKGKFHVGICWREPE